MWCGFSSALLEQSQKGHVDQMEGLKHMISRLEASLADKQAENLELKSFMKSQKQKSKRLLEQVTTCCATVSYAVMVD